MIFVFRIPRAQYYLTPTNTTSVYLSGPPSYGAGPLGQFYYPTNGSLTNLFDKGSTTASAATLYHYTVRPDNVPETNAVDLGFI